MEIRPRASARSTQSGRRERRDPRVRRALVGGAVVLALAVLALAIGWREGFGGGVSVGSRGPAAVTPPRNPSGRDPSAGPAGGASGGAPEVAVANVAVVGPPGTASKAPSNGGGHGSPAMDEIARDARLTGRVVDATGGPVAGARVSIRFAEAALTRIRAAGSITAPRVDDAEWITDAEGRFQGLVATGRVLIEAWADAYTSSRKGARAPAEDVVLVLAPAATVRGRVEQQDGSPVSGADVQALARGAESGPLTTRTDERGNFLINGVRSGIVEIRASAAGFGAAHEWLRLSVAEASAPLVLTLVPARSVYGRVSIDGKPCAMGRVRSAGPLSPVSHVDAQGRYRVDGLLDGTHTLTVHCTGAAPETRTVDFGPDTPQSIELNWELGVGLSLRGSVHDGNGEPVAGARVTVLVVPPPEGAPAGASLGFMGQDVSSCTSDAAGAFECRGIGAGWYRAGVLMEQGAPALSDPVRVDAESSGPVQLVLPATGEVRVSLSPGERGALPVQAVTARGDKPFVITATPRGSEFVFENLPLGRYRIAVGRARSELGPSAVDVELARAGQIVVVELAPPVGASIAGSVIDDDGNPLPDAWVKASLAETNIPLLMAASDPVLTNADGSFELTGLSPGRYILNVAHPIGEAQKLDVTTGQRGVALVVEEYGSLAGAVTLADGKPASAFSVIILREPVGDARQAESERGGWSAPWLEPGDYRVAIMSADGGILAKARVEAGRRTQLPLTLDPALAGMAVLNLLKR
jgi:protocatechuate 3,4-dioxygenase beta subunit